MADSNVELGECYLQCSPCVLDSCTSQMFLNFQTEGKQNLIYQEIWVADVPPTAGSEPNCDGEPTIGGELVNFTCGTCTDPLTRGIPVEGLSVRYGCRVASTAEVFEDIDSDATKAAVDAIWTGTWTGPGISGEILFAAPQQVGNNVVVVISLSYAAELTPEQATEAATLLAQALATQLGTTLDKITVVLNLVADPATKRAIQASYEAVVTIGGAASLIASAVMSFLFLALFI